MVRRLHRKGHTSVVFDLNPDAVKGLVAEGATGSASFEEFVQKLERPRNVWLMVPAAHVDSTIEKLTPLLEPGDALIDGGNSHYHDDLRRAHELDKSGIRYLDVGTSGGVFGLERGYCLMIGGEAAVVRRLDAIWRALAPGRGALPRRQSSLTSERLKS